MSKLNPISLPKTEAKAPEASSAQFAVSGTSRKSRVGFGLFAFVLCLLFIRTLIDLARYSAHSALQSHALLVPFISLYLIWISKKGPSQNLKPDSRMGLIPLLCGILVMGGYAVGIARGWHPNHVDYLSITTFAFLCFLIAGCFWFFGKIRVKELAFPLSFLIFLVPLPEFAKNALEVFFQYTSAETANAFIRWSGTPFFRDGFVFKLPGISFRVAEECSGIRSSLVLFITSLLAGHLFLATTWKKWVLAAFVIPLAIARNGFRIFVIGMLCAHLDPSWMDSPVHHRGGPLFFALSLIPFFAFLVWLRKSDAKKAKIEA